jgi:hypothetical protein
MRRPTLLVTALGAAILAAGGCASSGASANAAHVDQPQRVSLAGGDSVGRRMYHDSPEFAVACTTPRTASRADVATVDTNADGQ